MRHTRIDLNMLEGQPIRCVHQRSYKIEKKKQNKTKLQLQFYLTNT